MSRKTNETFLETYLEIDRVCCEKFGIRTGGVTEYISRLNNARFAPSRDDILPNLVRYRNLRNRFAHEPGAIKRSDEVGKEDVRWLQRFLKDLKRKKDPVSKFVQNAHSYALQKKIGRIVIALLGAAVVALLITVIVLLSKGNLFAE